MKSLAEFALEVGKHEGASYVDVRIINQKYQHIQTKDLTVAEFNQGTSQGLGVRVLAGGGWGFASTQKLTKQAIAKSCERGGQGCSRVRNLPCRARSTRS